MRWISASSAQKCAERRGAGDKAAEKGRAAGAAAVRQGAGRAGRKGGRTGAGMGECDRAGDGLLCSRRPGVRRAFAAAVHRGRKRVGRGGGAAHRADDLLPQRAGSAEHAGGVCRAGGAGVTLSVQRKQAGQRCPAFSACKKVHSFCFGARAVDWG
nr:MAG TPA: hypothetical protein [Caudoviricetes sp.]